MARPVLAALLLAAPLTVGCRSAPHDSADYATPEARVRWITRRMAAAPPSPILDAHFRERDDHHRGGAHAGVPYTERYFCAVLTIDPADGPKWAAGLKGVRPLTGTLPWLDKTYPDWWPATADPAAFRWYHPTPLFGPSAGGSLGISDDGVVYVWMRGV